MKLQIKTIQKSKELESIKSGQVCPLPAKGALGSAILTIVIWNLNIILVGLGLGGVAFGAWFAKYRFVLYAITFSLLGVSFYRIYVKGKGDVGVRTRVVLWCVASLSIGLTAYSIIKNM